MQIYLYATLATKDGVMLEPIFLRKIEKKFSVLDNNHIAVILLLFQQASNRKTALPYLKEKVMEIHPDLVPLCSSEHSNFDFISFLNSDSDLEPSYTYEEIKAEEERCKNEALKELIREVCKEHRLKEPDPNRFDLEELSYLIPIPTKLCEVLKKGEKEVEVSC